MQNMWNQYNLIWCNFQCKTATSQEGCIGSSTWWIVKSRNNHTCNWKRTYTHIKSHCFSFKEKSTKLRVENRFKRGESILMYRFCVDFQYLNSNTQAFLYTISNVDELTGSFSRHIQNFISSIDFRFFSNVHFGRVYQVYCLQYLFCYI